MKLYLHAAGAALIALSSQANAHPGGLNAEGCHNDRKRGGYHCHGAGRSSPSVQQVAPLSAFGSGLGSERAFPNCAAARAAGAAPVRQGDPGYSHRLDRDGDGVVASESQPSNHGATR